VELPYDGNKLSMVILLPGADKFKSFEGSLTGPGLSFSIQQMQYVNVNLTMPKFSFSSQFGLKKVLSGLGMPLAFTPSADFSGMDGQKDLLIQDVVHKAFVAVDEDGTEAAAATGVIVGAMAAPVSTKDMTVDRPFIFLIRDIPTGSILFAGRVLTPAN
jgi:serpin B